MTTSIIAKLYRGPSPSSSFLPARQSLADCMSQLKSAKQKSISRQICNFDHGTNSNSSRSPAYLPASKICMPASDSKAAALHISIPIIGSPRSVRSLIPQQLGNRFEELNSYTHLSHSAGNPASSIHCCRLHPARDATLTVCFCLCLKDPPPGQLLVRPRKVDCRVIKLTRLQLAQDLLAAAKQSCYVCDMTRQWNGTGLL